MRTVPGPPTTSTKPSAEHPPPVATFVTSSTGRLAVVDAGMLCGWRRATPSIHQLHQAIFHLLIVHPDLRVAVVGDAALKHALPAADQVLLDADIEIKALVMAPAGTIGGFQGFLARVVEQAIHAGLDPVVITDRAIPDAPLGKVRLDGGRWMFDLAGTKLDAGTVAAAAAVSLSRRPGSRTRSSSSSKKAAAESV